MDVYHHFAERLRELRRSQYGGRVISQAELAKAIGVTDNTVSRWESATYKPGLDDVIRLAEFFDVPIASFFPISGEPGRERQRTLLELTAGLSDAEFADVSRFVEFVRCSRHSAR